jgi:hypothetical protein
MKGISLLGFHENWSMLVRLITLYSGGVQDFLVETWESSRRSC